MDKNFHELKRQLAELSETVNKFESEAVQLRIVELLFEQRGGNGRLAEPAAQAYAAGPGRTGRRAAAAARESASADTSGEASRRRSSTPSASGAVAALSGLVAGDFFKQKRSIGEVVKKCEEEFGVRYKSNAFSGPLSRYANNGTLKREKNAEGKYVYFK